MPSQINDETKLTTGHLAKGNLHLIYDSFNLPTVKNSKEIEMVLRGFILALTIPFQKLYIVKYAPFHIYKFPFIILTAWPL